MRRDSIANTIFVAVALCVVCSVLVSTAAVGLRPSQEANKLREKKKNILQAAGVYEAGDNVDRKYEARVIPKVVDLATGQYVSDSEFNPTTFDQRAASKDPEMSIKIDPENDLADIKRREKYSVVYMVKGESGKVEKYVLPVYGKGLWSTMYGFLALDNDLRTIRGLSFYEHGETPGLGGEVDNPAWKEQWDGKLAFGEDGEVQVEVIRGTVEPSSPNAEYKVDGLAGATITSRGVTNLIQYWLGPHGFGPYLDKVKQNK